jgi:ferredoxin
MRTGRIGFDDYPASFEEEADVCIIGAGAGGSSAACAIAERGLSVVVLEEGRHWTPSQFKASSTWAFHNLYAGRGTRATRGNAIIPMPGGRGVGGSTLINSAICFRTPTPVITDWRENHGCRHLDQSWMDACFDRIWTTIGVTINPPAVQRTNNDIFRQGSEALGLDGRWMARSAPGCTGCGVCQQGCPTGGKLSVDRSFLQIALDTGHVGVFADCRVDGVETEGGRIVAVTGSTMKPGPYTPAGTFRVRAKHFVSSAGPVGSPRFLLANGLSGGPVGENLHIHPTSGMVARFPFEIRPWEGVTQGYYVDCWKDGFLLQTFSCAPDQYYVTLPLSGDDTLRILADLKFYASAGAVVHDEDSTGSVGEGSLTYWLGDGDRERLLAGMRKCAEVYFAAGATEVVTSVHGRPPILAPDQIASVLSDDIPARDIGLYASHPWVADASVFPTSLGVNPQVTVMAMGLTVGRQVASA